MNFSPKIMVIYVIQTVTYYFGGLLLWQNIRCQNPPMRRRWIAGLAWTWRYWSSCCTKYLPPPHTSWSPDTGVSLIFPALIPSPSSPPPGHLMHMVHLKDEAGWCSHAELRTTMNKYYPPNIYNVILDPYLFRLWNSLLIYLLGTPGTWHLAHLASWWILKP